MKFYRLASGFPTKSGSLLPTKRGRELPTLTLLHLGCGVGVGVQCETCRVVAQRAGQRFHIHAAFQRQRGEGVAQVLSLPLLKELPSITA